jgi:hypothetical protein
MSKLAGISLLVVGASVVAYPFLKKEKKLTNEEILMSKGKEGACDLLNIKLNLVNSEIALLSPEYSKLYSKKALTNAEKEVMKELNRKLQTLNEKRFELSQKVDNECKGYVNSEVLNCLILDSSIKQLSDTIEKYASDMLRPTGSTTLSKDAMKILIDKYNAELLKRKNEFSQKNCRDIVEKQNLNESGYLLTTQSEKQEQAVLTTNYKEQYIYIGLGSAVLLAGLYIISKK